jgi:hypothetical protein
MIDPIKYINTIELILCVYIYIYIYIYIYTVYILYILHLGAFSIANAPRPN